MLMRRLEDLSLADVEGLRINGALESHFLEFKAAPVGGGDKEKREFLADVSAFANASGGDIVVGVKTKDGAADSVDGVLIDNFDHEKLRLGDIIRFGLEPKLSGVNYAWLPIEGSRGVVVIRVPHSWMAPHRVTFLKDMNFYVRNAAGKHPMSVDELRQSFTLTTSTVRSLRDFRAERVRAIDSGDIPFVLKNQPIVAIQFIPLSSIVDPADLQFDISKDGIVRPISKSSSSWQHTLEGFGTYSMPEPAEAYSLMFRTGAVECVAGIESDMYYPERTISLFLIEDAILDGWRQFKTFAKEFELEPPVYVFASVLGVKGLAARMGRERPTPARNNIIQFPEVLIDTANFARDPSMIFNRRFDNIANAFGIPRSPSYDADGNKVP